MNFIPIAAPVIGDRELEYVTDAVRSGWVSSIGVYIERFEKRFAHYIGVSHAIAVSNGTVALHLALHALGIGPGDEVLVPDLTFVATAHAVLQTGATPVFVDVERDTWCLDPIAAARAVTHRTKAIIPVHLYGHPADMAAINKLAEENGLFVIEDAAEAHGAEITSRRVGSLGHAAIFSFYGNKIITTGEGGMITTNDPKLAARLRLLKDHGMSPQRRYYHSELAFNYRMTNIQAALGLAQLEQIEEFIDQRRKVFRWYKECLEVLSQLQLNCERPGVKNVFWMPSIVLPRDCSLRRDELMKMLRDSQIDSRPFFVPMHSLPHLRHLRTVSRESDQCGAAEDLAHHGLNLPSGPHITRAIVQYISVTIRNLITASAPSAETAIVTSQKD